MSMDAISDLDLVTIKLEMAKCRSSCPDIEGCILSTVDGIEVMHQVSQSIPTERLATMNSSMLALAETLARESRQGLCRFVILENGDGRIVMLRVNEKLLLTCISNLDSNLGMVLNLGHRTANALTELLE